MSKTLVVVGATGLQGSAVVDYFLQHEPFYKLRGLTRKPTSDAAAALSKKGVEVVQADLEDVDSLKRAFAGANAIFAYTNFGELVMSQEAKQKWESGEVTWLGKAAGQMEIRQGKNIADAAADVPELERLVWSSLSDANKWSKGKYKNMYHFDSKAEVLDYMQNSMGLKGKVGSVQMGVFADNALRLPLFFAPKKVSYLNHLLIAKAATDAVKAI